MIKRIINSVVGISLSIGMLCTPINADESFSDFEDALFKDLMESDYTSMHYALKDYEKLNIEKPELNVGDASWEDYEETVEESQAYLDELHEFDYDSLTDTEKKDYQTIEAYLYQQINLNSYPYFDWAFNSSTGVIDNLLTTFTEFVFYEKEDFDDYLEVLASVPDYLDQCLENTKKQAEKGYFLTDTMLQDTEDAIDKFVEKTDDNELIRIFDENVDAFDGLSDSEKKTYKEKNRDIVLNSYIPAYKKVGEELLKLKGSRDGEYNVSSLEDGADYYQAYAQYQTSMNTDVDTMLDVCTQFLNQSIIEFYDLVSSHSDEINEEINLESSEDVLTYLEQHLDNFPELQKVDYNVKYLDPSVASDSVVAYYLTPPIDDIQENVIKVNGDNISDTTDLYIALSHEGFPGHLFQFNYYYSTNPANIRTQITMMGYQEGWAMYASSQALSVSNLNTYSSEYQKLNNEINYVLDAAVDLGVNGLGWSTSDISDYLNNLGLNEDSAKSLYDYVTEYPGVLLSYGVGVAMFELLQDKAENALGDDFDQKEFNTVILNDGPRTFELVEEDVNAYCGIENTDDNNIFKHISYSEKPDSSSQSNTNKSVNWILYGTIGVGIMAIGAISIIMIIKSRKDNPFLS